MHSWTLGHNTMQDADNQEVRIGTERVCASTVGPKVATPCQAQLHAERVFLHSWTQCRDTMLNTTDVQTYVCAGNHWTLNTMLDDALFQDLSTYLGFNQPLRQQLVQVC